MKVETNLVFHVLAFYTNYRMMPYEIVASNDSAPRNIISNHSSTAQEYNHVKGENCHTLSRQQQNRMWSHVIKTHWSPISVFPKMWLPGYSWQALPNFTDDPTVQNGPIETPYTPVRRSYNSPKPSQEIEIPNPTFFFYSFFFFFFLF